MKDTFKYNTAVDAAELASVFEALAEGARDGRLPVSESGRIFTLHPQGLIDLNIKVRRKAGRAKVTLDLAWPEDFSMSDPGQLGDKKLSSASDSDQFGDNNRSAVIRPERTGEDL